MKFIIKLFPEITIKSKPVRKRYINTLSHNISESLKKWITGSSVKSHWDNVEVFVEDYNEDVAISVLSKIPGIHSFIKVKSYEYVDFDDTYEKVADYYSELVKWKTFVVRAKRAWEHKFKSTDIERYVGYLFLQKIEGAKVDLHNPEVTISFEIRDDILNVIEDKHRWIWGYPVWVQDRVLSLISWGFDSPVASFLTMKRWAKMDYVFFNLGWNAHEIWVKQISHYLWHTFSPATNSKFITVNFEEVIWDLLQNVNHKYRWIILKRLMLKVTDLIYKTWDYAWIVTWEAIGQVSSQTLTNLWVITQATENLILRPLLTTDKDDIIKLSRVIWTHDFSANMPEYCWVVSDKPSTWAKYSKILEEEENLTEGIIERAFEWREEKPCYKLLDDVREISKIEEIFEITDETIIDIREISRIQKFPLEDKNIHIPFFQINNKFATLDQTKTYAFYCDKWVISNLHAVYLKDKWFNNIKVYRP